MQQQPQSYFNGFCVTELVWIELFNVYKVSVMVNDNDSVECLATTQPNTVRNMISL